MKIRYANTKWEIIKGQWQMMRFSRPLLYVLGALGLFVFYSSFTYSEIRDQSVAFKLFYSAFYFLFTLGFGIIGGLTVSALSVILGKGKGLVGEHQLTITEEGLEEITEYNRSLNKWSGMRGLKESGSFYFLYVTDSTAHLVPKKKSLIDGHLEVFIQEFSTRSRNA